MKGSDELGIEQLNNQSKGTTVRLMVGIDFVVTKCNQPRVRKTFILRWETIPVQNRPLYLMKNPV